VRRLFVVLCWLLAAPVYAQTGYQYQFDHNRLNTTFYQTCVDSQACISVGFPATNVVTFILTPGTHSIHVNACNANGCAVGASISVTVCAPITLSPTTLPGGQVTTPYSQSVTAAGGTGPYTFTVSSGSLPAALALSSGGGLTGTPTTVATSTFTIRATAANACTGSRAYSVAVVAAPPPPPPPCPTVTLSPTTLSSGTVGVAYSTQVSASGGQSPYVVTLTTGSLPAGLTVTTAGALSGTPTTAVNASFTLTATDANACPGSRAYTLSIAAAIPPCPTITVTPPSLPSGTVGTAYSQTLVGSGGAVPYVFTKPVGSFPAGLTLTSAGALSGTPTTAVNAGFTITATDANACLGSRAYTVSIVAAPTPPPGALLDWQFPTSASPRFAGSTWQSTIGPDGVIGWMGVTGALTTDTSFPATSTGTVRFDWYVRVRDGLVRSGTSADLGLYLLPADGAITAANSAGSVIIRRSRQAKATSALVKIQIQNGGKAVVLTTGLSRGVWHKVSILAAMTARTSQILLDDVLVSNIKWPNTTMLAITRIGILSGSNVPITDFDKLRVVSQ